MAKIAIFLETGFEDTEAISIADVLRRANSHIKGSFDAVDFISVNDKKNVTGSWNTTIVADKLLKDTDFTMYDGLVIPGGKAVEKLLENQKFLDIIETHGKKGKMLGAICAAPQILGKLGLVDGKEVTHYPECTKFLDKAIKKPHMAAIEEEKIITGSSIGSALSFALQIVDHFTSTEEMLALRNTLVFNYD